MRLVGRATLILVALLVWASQVQAQIINPPSTWHPYRGGVNCVQVADANGNFSCSPLVTINPATGLLSLTGGSTGVQTFPGVVVAALGSTAQALGTGDLVISTSPSTVAPVGPVIKGATLRVRSSPLIPGYCRLVISGGNSLGQEFPIALLNPAAPLLGGVGFGLSDIYVVDFPGGPGGC